MSETTIKIRPTDKIVLELFHWLNNEAQRLDYGEIGVSVVLHQGKIVRAKKHEERGIPLEPKSAFDSLARKGKESSVGIDAADLGGCI